MVADRDAADDAVDELARLLVTALETFDDLQPEHLQDPVVSVDDARFDAWHPLANSFEVSCDRPHFVSRHCDVDLCPCESHQVRFPSRAPGSWSGLQLAMSWS